MTCAALSLSPAGFAPSACDKTDRGAGDPTAKTRPVIRLLAIYRPGHAAIHIARRCLAGIWLGWWRRHDDAKPSLVDAAGADMGARAFAQAPDLLRFGKRRRPQGQAGRADADDLSHRTAGVQTRSVFADRHGARDPGFQPGFGHGVPRRSGDRAVGQLLQHVAAVGTGAKDEDQGQDAAHIQRDSPWPGGAKAAMFRFSFAAQFPICPP